MNNELNNEPAFAINRSNDKRVPYKLWHRGLLILMGLLMPFSLAMLGDVDNDGSITSADATWVMESIAGTRTLDANANANADVDDTGGVEAADAHWILQVSSGEVSQFPSRFSRSSGPIAIQRDGALVGVINPDNDSVSFVSSVPGTVQAEVFTGREPSGLDFSRDGKKAYVTNGRDRTLAVVDINTFTVTNLIPLGAQPFAVVVSHRGDLAYVSNMMADTISVIDLASESELEQIDVAADPQGMAVSADSGQLYVTHLMTSVVSVVDTETKAVTSISLAETPFNALDVTSPAGVANRIKSIALRPGNDEAWVPHILSNVKNSVEVAFNTAIFPAVSVIDTQLQTELSGERMTLFAGIDTIVAHPEAIAFSPDGALAYAVSAASNDLTIFNASTRQQVGILRDIGDNPRGIVIHPNGNTAYVYSHLSPLLTVVDLGSETIMANITTADSLISPQFSEGRRVLLSSATSELSRDRFMSCASCHFDGRIDGQTWLFANGPRQTQTLAGDSTRSGLQHHNGDRINLQDFAIAFTGLQGGTGLTPDQLDNMAEFANTIRFLDNPNVEIDGEMSASALIGRRIFKQRQCDTCHNGPLLTDADGNNDVSNPLLHDVGTFTPGTGTQDATDRTRDQDAVAGGTLRAAGTFETSYLVGINATAPYLHNGIAATLLDTLTALGNSGDKHGITLDLSANEMDDLAAYLDALDIRNRRVQIRVPADNSPVAALTEIKGITYDDVQTLDLFINDTGPISATLNGNEFSASVPSNLVPLISNGVPFEISARGLNGQGEAARDDIEVAANFASTTSQSLATIDAVPTQILADGNATSTITFTPRNSSGELIGSGLTIDAMTTLGSLGTVIDQGDGSYQATLLSGMSAGVAVVSANVSGEGAWVNIASVSFSAGDVDPSTSSITASLPTIEADGLGTLEITVLPRDAFGNNIGSGQTVNIGVSLGSVGTVVDQSDGRYTAIYTSATTQGVATVTATVNGVLLNLMPQISLQPDVTAPAAPVEGAITFSAVVNGVTTIVGGVGSTEAFATVRVENLVTGQFALATANPDGSFSVNLVVGVNEEISIRVDDIAGNMSNLITVTPFIVEVTAISGIVQEPLSGGGFTPVAGATVLLYEVDLSGAPTIGFNPLSIPSVVTAADGTYTIQLPNGFVPDTELVVVTGPDSNGDGFIEAFGNYSYVNNIANSVSVDVIGSAIINGIANNFFWLNAPAVPANHFSATERIDINSTLRAATTELDFFGLDPSGMLGAIAGDVFLDPSPDALDTLAKTTFEAAAQSPGDAQPPVTLMGRLNLPDGAGGNIPLSNVQVQMGTLQFENSPGCNSLICVSLITGAVATTDGSGDYSITVPGFVDPGTSTVIVAVGELNYDSVGMPGPFIAGGSQYSLAGFHLDSSPDNPVSDLDVAARAAASLIQLQGVPIENFNANEMNQLIDLLRIKVAGLSVVTANKTLTQVLFEIFNLLVVDFDVATLLTSIADPQQNSDTTLVTANPVTLEADGVSVSVITIEPRNQLAEPVGPGRVVFMTTTVGTITSPAIDNGDGFYTAYLTAPTTEGVTAVAATIEGVTFDQQPIVTFTADLSSPILPNSNNIVFTGIGSTITAIGLPGAVEAFSVIEIHNLTLGLTFTVVANADGSFRADVSGSQGDLLRLTSTDAAGNASSPLVLPAVGALDLPAIANNTAIPPGVQPSVTELDIGNFSTTTPAGFTFVTGFELNIDDAIATEPLQVLVKANSPVPVESQVILAQELQLVDRTVWRVLSAAVNEAAVVFPQEDAAFPGVIESGKYAYFRSNSEVAFVHGIVSGSRGPLGGTLVRLIGSEFEDLSRKNGTYLLVGDVSTDQQFVSAQTWTHTAAIGRDTLMSYAGSITRRDISIPTRADTAFGFTQRFNTNNGQSESLFIKPDGTQLYLIREAVGDIEVIDTSSFEDVSLIDNPESFNSLSFTPNGSEAFVGAFSRIRELNTDNEQLGLEQTDVGFPKSVATTFDGNTLLIASSLDNSSTDSDPDAVFVLDTFSNVLESTSISIGSDPTAIAVNRTNDRAYIVSKLKASLTVIDIPTRTVLDEMPLGVAPQSILVAENGLTLYVVDTGSDELLVVDAALTEDGIPGNEIISTLTIGDSPLSIAMHPDGQMLFVSEQDDDTVSVIDVVGPTLLNVFAVTDRPKGLTVHPDGTRIYVTDTFQGQGILEVVIRNTDDVSPEVYDTGPWDRSVELLQDSPIEVVFSEPMDASTINTATIVVTDAEAQPIAGAVESVNNGVAAIFTPAQGVRYTLNSALTVSVAATLDDSGNVLTSSFNAQISTYTIQLPDVVLTSIDISTSGVMAIGQAGAVEPLTTVSVTNLNSGDTFSGTAAADGSFSVNLVGLDNDGYELVTSLFGGRVATNPVVIPVNFTVQFPNPGLFSYAPGPDGTLTVTGAPGAIDVKTTQLVLVDSQTQTAYSITNINPDGSFSFNIMLAQGVTLGAQSTLLESVVLDPIIIPGHSFPAPSIEFAAPNTFVVGQLNDIVVAGENFGGLIANHKLTLDTNEIPITLLDIVDGTNQPALQFSIPLGSDGGLARIHYAGQVSNSTPVLGLQPPNTDPIGVTILDTSVGDASPALGFSDQNFVDLGAGGYIVMELGTTARQGFGADLRVFAQGELDNNCYRVLISAIPSGPFISLGEYCGTKTVDLGGVSQARYVRIEDLGDGGGTAAIDAVQVLNIKLTITVNELDTQGNILRQVYPAPAKPNQSRALTVTPSETDVGLCPTDTKMFSVTVAPAPTVGGYYGPPTCTDSVMWTVSGTDSTTTPSGTSTTFTAGMMTGRAVVQATATRSGGAGCSDSGTANINVDVVKVNQVEWMAKDSPLSANDHSSGTVGKKIFPDGTSAGDGTNRRTVKVKVSTDKPADNVELHFKLLDVDDPSTDNAPVDSNMAMGGDNRDGSPALSMMKMNTDMMGVAEFEFDVGDRAGDNYRIAATCNVADFTMPAMVDDNTAPGSNAQVAMFPGHISELLTVWRRVHIEVDSMGAPPAMINVENGKFRDFVSATNRLTNATEISNTTNMLGDGSNDLDTAPVRNGRFENGMLGIPDMTGFTTMVTASGNRRARFAAANLLPLSFDAEDNDIIFAETMSGTVTEVTKVGASFRYTLNITSTVPPVGDWPDFVGGEITLDSGDSVSITAVNAVAMTVTASGLSIPYDITDDDVLPANVPSPDTGYMVPGWKEAYMQVLFDTGSDSPNTAFDLNTSAPESINLINADKGIGASTNSYWQLIVLGGFQGQPTDDNDPDREGTPRAWAYPTLGISFMGEENLRDWIATSAAQGGAGGIDPDTTGEAGRKPRRQEVLNHEIGHLFGLNHPDGNTTGNNPNGGVMRPSNSPRQSHKFSDASLNIMRNRQIPGP